MPVRSAVPYEKEVLLRALNEEIAAGTLTIDAWAARTHGGLVMPHHAGYAKPPGW